ncbi:MAG: hypothetical protein HY548_04615 [Elusimicrobia bacterium]|nr:hypothetical protein [Elusimicrobiota bacterium]
MRILCPYCGNDKVRYASAPLKHWARRFLRSRKRYCTSCREKWHIDEPASAVKRLLFHPTSVAIFLCLGVSLLLVVLMNASFDPVRWAKKLVRLHYDKTYGEDAKQKLWTDFSGLYGSRGNAQGDYYEHPKN